MSMCWNKQIDCDIADLLVGPVSIVEKFDNLKKNCKDGDADSLESALGQPYQTKDLTLTQIAIPSPGEVLESNVDRCCITLNINFGKQDVVEHAAQIVVKQGSIEAEIEFQGYDGKIEIHNMSGERLDPSTNLTDGLQLVLSEVPPATDFVSPNSIAEQPVSTNPLLKVKSHGFLNLQGPSVMTVEQASSLRAQTMLGSDRATMLKNQGFVWGDDEIVWHLSQIQHEWTSQTGLGETIPHIIDPLLAKGWVSTDATSAVHAWFQSSDMPSLIMTVVLNRQHWIPFVCHFRAGTFEVSYLRNSPADEKSIQHLVNTLAVIFQLPSVVVPVETDNTPSCGAHAIAFIRHLVLSSPLPTTPIEVVKIHEKFRCDFEAAVHSSWVTYHPWIWGAGPDLQEKALDLLKPVLKEQGVQSDHLQSRCLQAIKACGAEDIVKACQSKAPWRNLKAIGNNVKFQFLFPLELQEKIASKAGHQVAKKKPGSKQAFKESKQEEPIQLDPTKLSIPDGTFHCENQPLTQIMISQIGPLAEGIVVATVADAEPYLKANKFVSTGPLALIILNAPSHTWSTNLPHAAITVPGRCIINQEPLLLQASLVQLGQGTVEKALVKASPQLDSVQVATVKATVYKDEVNMPWEQFVSSPVKYILQQFPCLKLCNEPHCNCECWHNIEKEPIQTAVVDVWRRQFMRVGFKPEVPRESSIFSVCLRIPRCLLDRLLSHSGAGGTYLEPRTLDSRDVDRSFDIVWVPKADKAAVQHLKQTNPATIGLARVGDRFGLRVRNDQAEQVHQIVRPDAVFLPQGPRLQFSATPIPYGTDRQTLSKVLKSFGWEAKPIQPVGSVAGRGNTWSILATCPPPSSILNMSHGEVVISTVKAPELSRQSDLKPVAATATLNLCGQVSQSQAKNDPWLAADPWQAWQGPKGDASTSAAPEPQTSLRQLETKIEQAVLAKLPQQPVSMDQDDVSERVGDLEKQVQVLMHRQQTLETSVQEHNVQQSAQLTQLQGQINAQSQQVAGQLANQQQTMHQLFETQMAQIRNLLSKRPRDTDGE